MAARRRPSKHLRQPRPLSAGLGADAVHRAGWAVRQVTGSRAIKDYRCPACHQVITAGTPHVVAWPTQPGSAGGLGSGGPKDRRHWHSECWRRIGPGGLR